MKTQLLATLFVLGLVVPAWAMEANYFVTIDTVGNCSVAHGKPSAGQEPLGESAGYASYEDAKASLDGIRDDKCEGVVE